MDWPSPVLSPGGRSLWQGGLPWNGCQVWVPQTLPVRLRAEGHREATSGPVRPGAAVDRALCHRQDPRLVEILTGFSPTTGRAQA